MTEIIKNHIKVVSENKFTSTSIKVSKMKVRRYFMKLETQLVIFDIR